MYVRRYVWIYVFYALVMESLEMHKVRKACWEKSCYVIVKPQQQGRNPDTKLIMSMQGYNKTGTQIWKQDDKMWEKVDEIYLYMYERLHNLQ